MKRRDPNALTTALKSNWANLFDVSKHAFDTGI